MRAVDVEPAFEPSAPRGEKASYPHLDELG